MYKLYSVILVVIIASCGLLTMDCGLARSAIVDTYFEDFDDRADDTSIDGIDNWSVARGVTTNAITQDTTTYTGTGKALQIAGAATSVNLTRATTYGSYSPCWIEFMINPGLGSQATTVPSSSIAAVSFDYTGKIYASDSSSWTDTGETFTAGEWYRVILKLDFDEHLYDIYISPVASPEVEFIADKSNLNFIDSTLSSLGEVGFGGAYSTTLSDDSYIDDLVVHFIDRLEIITASQSTVENKPSNPITVQLQNSYSEPQTAWTDITLELRSSSDSGSFSLDKDTWTSTTQVVIPEDAQGATFYYKDSREGKPSITVEEYPDRGWTEAVQQMNILGEVAFFDVEVLSPQVAGEYFTIEITAKDEEGNIDEFYTGEVDIITRYISPHSGTMKVSPQIVSGFSSGQLEVSAVYPDCGIIEIIVEDRQDSSKAGISGEIIFIPEHFSVLAQIPQIVNRDFALTVNAFNAEGELTPNYQGPAGLIVIPVSPEETAGGLFPATVETGDFSAGSAEVSARFNRWGRIKIEAHDLAHPERKGRSEIITFLPQELVVEPVAPSEERDFYYVGEDIPISIYAIDALDEVITNYLGLINISFSMGFSLPDEFQFLAEHEGKHTFLTRASSAGVYEVEAVDDESKLKGESGEIEVKQATLEVVSTYAPVGTTEVIIKLMDELGNIIKSENDLTVQISLEEEHEDFSAASSATEKPVTFRNGIAKVLVSNTQPEIVIISPSSEYKFEVKKGTVTFGRIAKTGIGTLMWREIKE